jgi:glycosyltransferase involved in cell wall biosynthesis
VTPEIGRLQAIAVEEGVADSVTFVGRRGRSVLRYYYSAADVFVSTPWYEPFGITPVEAMACGTPVVGSNVGGIKTTVADGTTGFLVPPNDPPALAQRLAHLYRNPAVLAELGRRAVQRANRLYTWKSVADRIGACYERVLARRHIDTIGARHLITVGPPHCILPEGAGSTLAPALHDPTPPGM